MIFPFLKGIPSFDKAPFTWMLMIVCLLIFLSAADTRVNSSSLKRLSQTDNLQFTGAMYKQYLISNNKIKAFQEFFQVSTLGSDLTFGEMALRDYDFLTKAKSYNFTADPVFLKTWRVDIADFIDYMQKRPMTIFGLSAFTANWKNLITYQFMHGSVLHLFSNMMILFLFGFVLEEMLGGLIFVILFLCSGFVGAVFFINLSGLSGAPMIGASGAISGLIAFYAITETRKNIKYLYFFSPVKSFYGFVYLPTWLIIPVCFAADIASYLATPVAVGGVAYAAHIGGALFGLFTGLVYKFNSNFIAHKA